MGAFQCNRYNLAPDEHCYKQCTECRLDYELATSGIKQKVMDKREEKNPLDSFYVGDEGPDFSSPAAIAQHRRNKELVEMIGGLTIAIQGTKKTLKKLKEMRRKLRDELEPF